MTFVDVYDLDINLELKYYPGREEFFFSREIIGNISVRKVTSS